MTNTNRGVSLKRMKEHFLQGERGSGEWEKKQTFRSMRERGTNSYTALVLLQPGHLQRRKAWRLGESGKDLIYWKNDRGKQLEASKAPSSSGSVA